MCINASCVCLFKDASIWLSDYAAQEDSLSENELTDCLLALRSVKATGWDNIPIEAYRGSCGARDELTVPQL